MTTSNDPGIAPAVAAKSLGLRLLRQWWPSLLVTAAVLAWFVWRWPTLAAFVGSVDYHEQFLQDFVGHYLPMARSLQTSHEIVPGYLYPSTFAVMLMPLAALSTASATNAWVVVQILSILGLLVVSARAMTTWRPLGSALTIGLVLISVPLLSNFKWGQVSVPITAGIFGAWWAMRRDRPLLAGALLGLCAAVKVYPILFVGMFVLNRSWRALLAFAASFALIYAALPIAVLGLDAWLTLERSLLRSMVTIDVTANINSQSTASVAVRWFYLATDRQPSAGLVTVARWTGYVAALLGLGCALLLQRRRTAVAFGLPLAALFSVVPFLVSSSWPHYFVYLPPCLLATGAYALRHLRGAPAAARRPRLAIAVLCIVTCAAFATGLPAFDLCGHWMFYNGWAVLFVADCGLLLALLLCLALPVHDD